MQFTTKLKAITFKTKHVRATLKKPNHYREPRYMLRGKNVRNTGLGTGHFLKTNIDR